MNGASKRFFFTPAGIERLRRRIADTKSAYQAVCDSNAEAREAGDSSVWHDNFAFEENQRQMHQLARRIRDLDEIFTHAEVVSLESAPERVTIGTRVRYRLDTSEQDRICHLVGWDDGDPSSLRVSYNSPLGAAMIGAAVGEEREFVIAGRSRAIEVLAIDPSEDL